MTNCHLWNCIGGQSSQGNLSSNLGCKGTHTKVYKFLVNPYPNLGYCGCTVKLDVIASRAKARALTISSSESSGVEEHMSKHLSRMTHHSKVFITIFTKYSHLK